MTDIELHLEGWNCMPHCCSHCASLSKSFCSVSQSEKFLIGLYRIQSSAKSRVCDDTAAGKSLINVRKRRCPRTDPWGTPLTTGSLLDDSHQEQPAAFCCLGMIISILRWYLLCHNYPVYIVVSYGALYQRL